MLIKGTQDKAGGVSIELTPMIDMVFLLLIFFLIATTFHQSEREMKIALPDATSGGPISAALKEIIVNVDAEGAVIVAGRTLGLDELRTLISGRVAINPEQKVSVRGDRAAAYAHIVNVLDICKASGIAEPYIDTVFVE